MKTALVKRRRQEVTDEDLVQLQNRLIQIQFRKKALKIEEEKIRKTFAKAFGLGRYPHMTVYQVSEHWVKRHKRETHRVYRSVLRKGGR